MSSSQLAGMAVAVAGVLVLMYKPILSALSSIKIPSVPKKSDKDCRPDLYASLFHIRDHLSDCKECTDALDNVIAPKIAAVKPGSH